MKTKLEFAAAAMIFATCCLSCENVDGPWNEPHSEVPVIELGDVALLLAGVPLSEEQLGEVYDAVSSSRGNGYDEEYTMNNLFCRPGSGVGEQATKTSAREYATPLRELLRSALENYAPETRSAIQAPDILHGLNVDAYLDALQSSDIQIYWPYSDDWDGKSLPVITYDPEDASEANMGYEVVVDETGNRSLREMIVTEDTAMQRPVWVINRNDDSAWTTLELLIRDNPAWSEGGGNIIICKPSEKRGVETKASPSGRALILKDFNMLRQFDSWFGGASEFFCKIGCIDDFHAKTEAELKLYAPLITDFMLVVPRKDVATRREVNAMLMSNWTDQLSECALMIVEDDGGARTSWSCSGTVKVASKSYGFDISIPLNERDDIVWRGNLAYDFVTVFSGKPCRYGDVEITFEILEY